MVSSDEANQIDVNKANSNHEDSPLSPKSTVGSVAPASNLAFHKSVSLINLSSAAKVAHRPKIRFSIDANGIDSVRGHVLLEGDHVYTSGLRRIRQQGASSIPSPIGPPSSWSVPGSRVNSICLGSPTHAPSGFGNCENLSKFPSESLHSFSFAHQSEDFIHSRQNIIKRGIEFMRDKLGWAGANPHITSAQAKVQGDHEMVNVMEFLQKANLVGPESTPMITGPVTGPAMVAEDGNPFEKSFGGDEGGDSASSVKDESNHVHHHNHQHGGDQSGQMFDEPGTMDPSESIVRKGSLKRTYTDTSPLTLQTKIFEALAQPYIAGEDPTSSTGTASSIISPHSAISGPRSAGVTSVHNHSNRYAPASQAIFTTEKQYPWTILAANDLACLVFGVTKAEVRKIGILEVVKEERREWLAAKLRPPPSSRPASRSSSAARASTPRGSPRVSPTGSPPTSPPRISPTTSGYGFQRVIPKNTPRRSNSEEIKTVSKPSETKPRTGRQSAVANHVKTKSRGVILCGDVVPIQKRNGHIGAASLWVKEKKSGLIWVMEEITEDVAYVYTDRATGRVIKSDGDMAAIFGEHAIQVGVNVAKLLPRVPKKEFGGLDFSQLKEISHYTASNGLGINIPCSIQYIEDHLRIASFPHIAGIVVLSAETLQVLSSNTVFATALFGQSNPTGLHINELIPQFDDLLKLLEEEEKISLVDGLVLPEHSFRRARAHLALREGKSKMAATFLRPSGLPAIHKDGGELKVDVQMRVVTSESDSAIIDTDDSSDADKSEVVYALWITYSRQLHAASLLPADPTSPLYKRVFNNEEQQIHQPSPGQSGTPVLSRMDSGATPTLSTQQPASLLREKLEKALQEGMTESKEAAVKKVNAVASAAVAAAEGTEEEAKVKKTIADFVILEDMGQGAYGQVKLARYKKMHTKRVVLKYVTKKRILVDTWTRDRKLGTVPLEIHVLNFLRREDLKHPNIVEMSDFFEDDVNYYIEMVPHGLPGMDLFDYIELKVNMDEAECQNIFVQVVMAIQHLHTKALVVHRDIKDENVVLDGEGKIKLIDFGSAAYIKSGPFDVFVGTIDYAAPEVLAGKSYRGKEQDVWALGVLLYTICYKENPFYNIDEIMDRDLRIPYVVSEDSIDLIKSMLNRDVEKRLTITQVLEHPWCQAAESLIQETNAAVGSSPS